MVCIVGGGDTIIFIWLEMNLITASTIITVLSVDCQSVRLLIPMLFSCAWASEYTDSGIAQNKPYPPPTTQCHRLSEQNVFTLKFEWMCVHIQSFSPFRWCILLE